MAGDSISPKKKKKRHTMFKRGKKSRGLKKGPKDVTVIYLKNGEEKRRPSCRQRETLLFRVRRQRKGKKSSSNPSRERHAVTRDSIAINQKGDSYEGELSESPDPGVGRNARREWKYIDLEKRTRDI